MKYLEKRFWKYEVYEDEPFHCLGLRKILPDSFDFKYYSYDRYKDNILAKEGYRWDGASGSIDRKTNMRASCIHDIFTQFAQRHDAPFTYNRDALKVFGDQYFYETLRKSGMSWFEAKYHYQAVKLGAGYDRRIKEVF